MRGISYQEDTFLPISFIVSFLTPNLQVELGMGLAPIG